MVINVLAVLKPALFLVHLKKSICISNLFNKQDMNKTMEKNKLSEELVLSQYVLY